MSIFSEKKEFEDDIKRSAFSFEDIDEFPIFKKDEEDSYSSYIFSNKKGNPLFIDNESFVNYFMHIDYNTPINNEKNNITSSQSYSINPPKETNASNDINKKDILLKKTKRDKDYGVITDNLTGVTYYEKDDPINFRKAKKRIQNRESALRMKKLRENNNNKIDEELNRLKGDNIRLINENIALKKEKIFLIEQIQFMKKIIKEANLEYKLKNNNNNIINENENENKFKEPIFYYNGYKQKIKGKLFNVFMVCILSIVYIVGECYDGDISKNGLKKNRNNEHSIHLNSVNNKEIKAKTLSFIWFYISKLILAIIFFFIVPLFKDIIGEILELINKSKRKKYI